MQQHVVEILNAGMKTKSADIINALKEMGVQTLPEQVVKHTNNHKARLYFKSIADMGEFARIVKENVASTSSIKIPAVLIKDNTASDDNVATTTTATALNWKLNFLKSKNSIRRFQEKKQMSANQNMIHSAASQICPWKDIPYEEQLQKKHEKIQKAFAMYGAQSDKALAEKVHLHPTVISSPNTMGYRNKIDYTIGFDKNGDKCVGFRVASFNSKAGIMVEGPEECAFTVSALARDIGKHVENFVKKESKLEVFDSKKRILGFWRGFTFRHSESRNTVMLVFKLSKAKQKAEMSEEEKKEMKTLLESLVKHFPQIVSVFVKFFSNEGGNFDAEENNPESNSEETKNPYLLLHGVGTIEEEILGKKFLISPGAFFQVNTQGAEKLFGVVKTLLENETAKKNKEEEEEEEEVVLLDLCCGTGVIGIVCSDSVHHVIGIEMVSNAIEDAKKNAERNSLGGKTEYHCAKVEDVLKDLLSGATTTSKRKKFVAILDPPRSGMHPAVLKILRRVQLVESVIYISCNPTDSFIQDALVLSGHSTTKKTKVDLTKESLEQMFEPRESFAVDMFPHTDHIELVTLFRRKNEEQVSSKKIKLL